MQLSPLTEQLRQAIDNSGLTRYRIAKDTGVSESTLSLWYRGRRRIPSKVLDAVGTYLRLKLVREEPKDLEDQKPEENK